MKLQEPYGFNHSLLVGFFFVGGLFFKLGLGVGVSAAWGVDFPNRFCGILCGNPAFERVNRVRCV